MRGSPNFERMPVKTNEADPRDGTMAKVVGLVALVFIVALVVMLCVSEAGCSTVTPDKVESHEASYDGNAQNSGVISSNANGYVVTAHFRDRYNELVGTYGRDFKPALVKDAGMLNFSDGTFLIDKQHMVQFLEMNAWLRAGLKPANP